MATLEQYLKTRPFKGFKATPRYSEEGDCITFYFKNAPTYADRVDELLTVYLTLETHELAGCQIKGIGRIMNRLRELHITIKDKKSVLTMIFLVCRAFAEKPGPLETYETLLNEARRHRSSLPNELI